MIKAVIFDMYETLVTLFACSPYFGSQIAIDAKIPPDKFREDWKTTDNDRTTGKMTFEEALEEILKMNQCYSKERMEMIVQKRVAVKEECFHHLHPEIVPLLSRLKEKRIKIGLISNCFSEEAIVIRNSILFPYFDAVCLSYEQGVKKPDPEIYIRCMKQLSVSSGECFYVGDGAGGELEAARELGMNTVQAVWYLKEGTSQPSGRKETFRQIETPLDLLNYI